MGPMQGDTCSAPVPRFPPPCSALAPRPHGSRVSCPGLLTLPLVPVAPVAPIGSPVPSVTGPPVAPRHAGTPVSPRHGGLRLLPVACSPLATPRTPPCPPSWPPPRGPHTRPPLWVSVDRDHPPWHPWAFPCTPCRAQPSAPVPHAPRAGGGGPVAPPPAWRPPRLPPHGGGAGLPQPGRPRVPPLTSGQATPPFRCRPSVPPPRGLTTGFPPRASPGKQRPVSPLAILPGVHRRLAAPGFLPCPHVPRYPP